jgi:hypothetical protein
MGAIIKANIESMRGQLSINPPGGRAADDLKQSSY